MAQAYLLKLDIAGKLETFEQTETWSFRYAVIIGRVRSKHFECGIPVTVDEKLHMSCYFGANKSQKLNKFFSEDFIQVNSYVSRTAIWNSLR